MKFDILVVDPPWQYKNGSTGKGGKSSSSNKYETLTLMEIKYLISKHSRRRLLHDDSMMFLWTTNTFLPDAFDVMREWGFEYKTMITWVKKNYGLGNHFRGKTEHVLFGIRGKLTPFHINKPNVIISDKTLKHSEKPEEFYQLVDEVVLSFIHNYGRCNILELFARKQRENWTCIGKELTGNDIREDLNYFL